MRNLEFASDLFIILHLGREEIAEISNMLCLELLKQALVEKIIFKEQIY